MYVCRIKNFFIYEAITYIRNFFISQPPFPTNADLLDVDCSSMNDSFRKSCTVQLSAKLNNTISVTVSVHGSGVQMGYVYVVQATIHTSDGSDLESDLVTIGMHSKQ